MKAQGVCKVLIGSLAMVAIGTPGRADVLDGLTAYWRLNETGGTVAHDAAGGVYDATLNGDAAFVNDPVRGQVLAPGTPGVGNALVDGSNPIGTSAGTLMAWVNMADTDLYNYIFESVDYSVGSEPRIYVYAVNGNFVVGVGTTSSYPTSAHFDTGNWHQVALGWQESSPGSGTGEFTAFFDGVAVQGTNYSGLTSLGNYFSIASQHYPPNGVNGWSFKGLVSEAAAWNRYLTQAEVLELYNQGYIAPAPVAGDFDGNGIVDGADFASWQDHFPLPNGALLSDGDADGDGDVDGADFVVWQTHYAPSSNATSVVPEPATAGLILAGLVALVVGKVRSRGVQSAQ
jgi:hypothetical protein